MTIIKTIATWNGFKDPATKDEEQQLKQNYIDEKNNAGVVAYGEVADDGSRHIVTFVWRTEADAHAWVDYLLALNNSPESAVVVIE